MEAALYSCLKTYKKVDLYICPSHFLANKLLRASDIYDGKLFTIHNFIEKKFAPVKQADADPYIVFVGRLSKEKGVELLAQTAKLLPEYHFVVAGNGPDDACLQGIPNVTLKGFVTGAELTNLMANAQLLIAPSVCYENCPLSILEAHSLGVPVVTMNSGGMAELVEDGKTGGLAAEPTATSIAETIKKCLDDTVYQTLKEHCKRADEEVLGIKEYCALLIEQYNNLKAKG
jgi:glycosyltransferase involved in cell wall biosynthesis